MEPILPSYRRCIAERCLCLIMVLFQARAPRSKVIIVGTHLDRLPPAKRKDRLFKLESDLRRKLDKKGFPIISRIVFVSNSTGDGITKLRDSIYQVASKMQDSNVQEPMIGKRVFITRSLFNASLSLLLPPIWWAFQYTSK